MLEIDPDDRRALRLLDQLLQAGHRWADLAPVLAKQIALESEAPTEGEDDRRFELLLRFAFAMREKLGQAEAAIGALKAAMEHKPADPRVMAQLEAMLPDASIRHHAAMLLEPAYRLLKDYKKLVAIIEVRLASAEDKAERLVIFRDLMRIYEEELSQKPLAFMVACRACRENINDDGVRQDLERLAQDTGSFEELAGVYEEVLSQAEGSEAGDVEA